MRGVFIEPRHQTGCPAGAKGAKKLDPKLCKCSPTVRARIAGRWVLKAQLPKDWTATTRGGRQGDLEQFEQRAIEEKRAIDTGVREAEPLTTRSPLFGDWGRKCLDDIKAAIDEGDADALSTNTYNSYSSMWEKWAEPQLGHLHLVALTTDHFEALRRSVVKEGLSAGYAKQMNFMASGMLEAAINAGVMQEPNPARIARAAKYGKRAKSQRRLSGGPEKVLQPETVEALLASTHGTVLGDMIAFDLTSGLRERELIGVRVLNLDFARNRFELTHQLVRGQEAPPKYESLRRGVLLPRLAQRWRARDGEDGYLFIDPDTDAPFKEHKARDLLNAAWEAVAPRPKGWSWHVLRHTFATTLARQGVRQGLIDYVMGHSNAGIGYRYQHHLDEELAIIERALEAGFGACIDLAARREAEVEAPAVRS